MSQTLLLNATYEPLCVVPHRRAVMLVLQDKAEIVQEGTGSVRAASTSMPVPSVIRLTRFVKVPYRAKVRLTNAGVLNRDNRTCAYCGVLGANTIDHIQPRSRGGKHMWENVVAACRACNGKKGDKLLSEIGWKLRFTPFAPVGTGWVIIGIAKIDPAWETYLGRHKVPEFA